MQPNETSKNTVKSGNSPQQSASEIRGTSEEHTKPGLLAGVQGKDAPPSDFGLRGHGAALTLDEQLICRDKNSVDAIINSVAGLQPAPNVIIENRKAAE